ncbi:MAG: hypothetical protein ACUVUF_08510 [Candidatus Bathycorpusculaceae bacterium]
MEECLIKRKETYTHKLINCCRIQGAWVIPEAPSTIILLLFMLTASIVTVLLKTRAKNLNLIDTWVKSDTAKGYQYINEICKRLYSEIFSKKIKEHKSRFGFKIDQDFSLIVIHEFFWEYDEFQSYDIIKLKEATGGTGRI